MKLSDFVDSSWAPEVQRERLTGQVTQMLQKTQLPDGFSLCAVGSLARAELTPYSDVDLLLLHDGAINRDTVTLTAERLWYPLWDSGLKIDHSVRTPEHVLATALGDIPAALGLLDLTYIHGDEALAHDLRRDVLSQWRRSLPDRFSALVSAAATRWRRSGSVVSMTRPDLKNGRGGLRDLALLRALGLAQGTNVPDLSTQERLLLDVRSLLHVQARRSRDILEAEFADDIALRLGMRDRHHLSTAIADAGRAIDSALASGFATTRAQLPQRTTLRMPIRRPVDLGIVDHNGQLALARTTDMNDSGLPMRLAAAAGRTGLPVGAATWRRVAQCPLPPTPWPPSVLTDFCALLACGPQLEVIVEALQQHGIWDFYVPEWSAIQSQLPNERSHAFRLDRHLLTTVSQAADSSVHVARPDLLLIAALYHDLGKGHDEDHSVVGERLVREATARMGLADDDREVVARLVRQHVTLMRLARSRDPRDSATVDELLDAVAHDRLTLDLLEVLTGCDARATGPQQWTAHIAGAVRELARQARAQVPLSDVLAPVTADSLAGGDADAELPQFTIDCGQNVWTAIAVDHDPASLLRALAVIRHHRWSVLRAEMATHEGITRSVLAIRPSHNTPPSERALLMNFRSREPMRKFVPRHVTSADISWLGDVLVLRRRDERGILAAVVDVAGPLAWMRMETYADTVMIQLCLQDPGSRGHRVELENRLRTALGELDAA